jgi:hypothetical protein
MIISKSITKLLQQLYTQYTIRFTLALITRSLRSPVFDGRPVHTLMSPNPQNVGVDRDGSDVETGHDPGALGPAPPTSVATNMATPPKEPMPQRHVLTHAEPFGGTNESFRHYKNKNKFPE